MKAPKVIEFFAGIGGVASAWPEADMQLALDINPLARQVYELNHTTPFHIRALESLGSRSLEKVEADVWWLSPPCQPFTRKGNYRDWDDPRTAALKHLLTLAPILKPSWIVLENVVGFEDSQTFGHLRACLAKAGYEMQVLKLCPTEMRWPNRRPRVYLLASRSANVQFRLPLPTYEVTLSDLVTNVLLQDREPHLRVCKQLQAKFESGMHRVRLQSQAVTACFGASYGKALMRAGSYLCGGDDLWRFSPREVSRLLGFPLDFELGSPSELGDSPSLEKFHRRLWKLLGNSLSLPAVRYVVAHIHQHDDRFEPIDPAMPWL